MAAARTTAPADTNAGTIPADPDTEIAGESLEDDPAFSDDLQRTVGELLLEDADREAEAAGLEDDDEELLDDGEGEEAGAVAGDGEVPTDGKVGEEAAAGAPAADAAAGEAATTAAPVWADLSLQVGKVDATDPDVVTIPDAKVTKSDGYVHVAVPEGGWQRFEQRLARGYHAERRWRQIEQLQRQMEAEKAQEPRQSDREIEADLSLKLLEEVMGEDFNTILTQDQYENLKLRIQLAQRESADTYVAKRQESVSKAAEPAWEEQQVNGIAQTINQILVTPEVLNVHPELKLLTREEVQEVFQGLLPYARSLYYKDGTETKSDARLMLGALVNRAQQKQASTTGSTSAPSGSPASAATSTTTARPAGATTQAARADRLNRGADGAARTTSVKANRTTRPAATTTRGSEAAATETAEDRHAKAVEAFSRKSRAYIASPGWDMPDDDGEE